MTTPEGVTTVAVVAGVMGAMFYMSEWVHKKLLADVTAERDGLSRELEKARAWPAGLGARVAEARAHLGKAAEALTGGEDE